MDCVSKLGPSVCQNLSVSVLLIQTFLEFNEHGHSYPLVVACDCLAIK